MKILKRILFGILALVVLVLITALFVSKNYRIEKDVVVNKPKSDVFNYVKHSKNHDNFNKWIMQDPQIKKTYTGSDGTPGFVYAWNSDGKAGQGEQTTKAIDEGKRADFDIHFIRPMEGTASMWMTTDAVGAAQTKVKWGIDGKSSYPLNVMNLFVPGMLGKDMQESLNTLKNVLEK